MEYTFIINLFGDINVDIIFYISSQNSRMYIYFGWTEYTGNALLSWQLSTISGGVWFEELKFNKHCSAFVLFDKKFPILD
jgi:hypothetical protein